VLLGGSPSKASWAAFGALPALATGTDPCAGDGGTDGTVAFSSGSGAITEVCVNGTANGSDAGPGDSGLDGEADAAVPTLTIAPPSQHVAPGGKTVGLTATLLNFTGTIQWSIPPPIGSLSWQTGASVTYTSPAQGVGQLVVVTATVGSCGADAGGVCLKAKAGITIDPPLSDAGPPMGKGIVAIDRVVDFAVFGTHDPTAMNPLNNIAVRSPHSVYNKLNKQSPSPGPDKVYLDTISGKFSSNQIKVGHSANLDNDFEEETVTPTWTRDATTLADAMAKVTILDPTALDAGSPVINVVAPALQDSVGNPINLDVDPTCANVPPPGITMRCYTAYDYDLALADVDGDGYNEIIISGTVAASHAYTTTLVAKRGMIWVFDDAHTSGTGTLKLLWKLPFDGVSPAPGVMNGAMIARIAVGSMRDDRSPQLAIAWFDALQWLHAWDAGPSPHNQRGIRQFNYALYDIGASGITRIGKNELTASSTYIQGQLANETTSNNLLAVGPLCPSSSSRAGRWRKPARRRSRPRSAAPRARTPSCSAPCPTIATGTPSRRARTPASSGT
jgi:hypothetical protein